MRISKEKEASRIRTRRLTLCGILVALSTTVMYLGSFIDVLDLSVAVIASLFCILAVIEAGRGWACAVYGATALLSLVLLPNRSPAVVYLLFAGYYPILKERLEGRIRKRALLYAVKIAIFNVAFVIIAAVLVFVFSIPAERGILAVALFVLGNVTFLLYDVALTRMITAYIRLLRPRLTFLNRK